MDLDRATTLLPRTYRVALTLRDLGADGPLIAACLDVELSAVVPLHDVGDRKLRQLRRTRNGSDASQDER
jgi:hypothetical protein